MDGRRKFIKKTLVTISLCTINILSYLQAIPYNNTIDIHKIEIYDNINYEEVTLSYDGSPMNDSKVDNTIYRKKGRKYYVNHEFVTDKEIYVRDFGAKADGSTDNTAAFKALALFCKNINISTTVIFDKGTYMTREVIFEDVSDITFKGNSSKIKHMDGITTTNIFTIRAISKDCRNITFDSMYFEGGWSNVLIKPIDGKLISNVNITNSSFNKTKSAALWIEYSKNVNVLNSSFTYGGDNGIYVAFSEDVLISSNHTFNCSGSGGIAAGYKDADYRKGFEGGKNILITSNTVTSNYNSEDNASQFGIDVVMADNVTVEFNNIDSQGTVKKISNGIGLQEWRVSNVTVKENRINGIRDIGIVVGYHKIKKGFIVNDCLIENNTIKNVNYGIRAYGESNSITINKNLFEETKKEGVEIGSDAHNYSISNNIFKNCSMQSIWPNPGVITVKGRSANIKHNTFIDTQCGGTLIYTGRGTFTYSITESGLLKIFIDNVETKQIHVVNMTWGSLKAKIETVSGATLNLINGCENIIISGIRRTGLRQNDSVLKYGLPSFITTFEPKYYIYVASSADNCSINNNKFISNITKLPQNQIYDSSGNKNKYDNNSIILKSN